MAKRTAPIGFGLQKPRGGAVVCKFKKDPSRFGFVILEISGLTEAEARKIMPN